MGVLIPSHPLIRYLLCAPSTDTEANALVADGNSTNLSRARREPGRELVILARRYVKDRGFSRFLQLNCAIGDVQSV